MPCPARRRLDAGPRRSTTSRTSASAPPSGRGLCVVAPADATSPTPTRSSSASRRRSRRPRTRTSRRSCPPPRRSAGTCAPASSSSSSRRRSPARPPGRSARCSSGPGSGPASTSTSRSPRSGSTRAIRPAPARASRGSSGPRRRRPPTRAAALLRNINDHVVELSSPDAAELAKLLENVFRNVNIAFVNKLALLCERMGLDVWEVIDAAATKPFGFMRFTPGPGVGGHCIPVDPVLPGVASARVRLHRPVHRARRRHQLRDAAPRRRPRRRGAQRPRQGAQGREGRRPRRGLQAERPRRPQLAGRRRHRRASPSAAPTCATTTRTCRRSGTRPASCARTRRSTSCSDWADVDRRRDGPRGDRLGARLRAGRPRRRHRRQLGAGRPPGRARSCGWVPAGRRDLTAAARDRPRGAARPVLMIVHAYYDEDPRVRREAEALAAAAARWSSSGCAGRASPPTAS